MRRKKQEENKAEEGYTPAKWEAKFLELYRKSGNVTISAEGVGITRNAVYQRRIAYPEFIKVMETVREEAIEILEAVAWKRALKSSDTLLIFLLKSNKPEKYRETVRQELSNPDGSAISLAPNIYLPEVTPLPDETDEGDQADG